MHDVILYTDGSCLGNPGMGGWAYILIHGNKELRCSCYAHNGDFVPIYTTNDNMEIQAVIEGLNKLRYSCNVEVRTDSANIVGAFNDGWIERWRANDWNSLKNAQLWKQLYKETLRHNVIFTKVKAHSGEKYNDECDKMCRKEAKTVKNMFLTFCPDCGEVFNPSVNMKVKKSTGNWIFQCPVCYEEFVRAELDFIYNIKNG